MESEDSGIYFSLGVAYKKIKEYDKAVLNYKKALQIDPAHSIAHDNLKIVLDKIEQNSQNNK
ncbi:MAG: tetratricopeptide repeat protein [bacterium]|nr:tetratricopeptide repeat protein [bacterium]